MQVFKHLSRCLTVLLVLQVATCEAQDHLPPAHEGLRQFLRGDLKAAEDRFSQAIEADSLAYENYYLRGAVRSLSDTTHAIADFFKAVALQKTTGRTVTDSVLAGALSRPASPGQICSISLIRDQPAGLFLVMLGAWYSFQGHTAGACAEWKSAEKGGLYQVRAYRKKYCR